MSSSNLESSRTMSFSAPSAINMEHSIVKFDTEVEKFNIVKRSSEQSGVDDSTSHDSVTMHADSTTHDWQSLSNLTESTEQSAPINFDMSNRVGREFSRFHNLHLSVCVHLLIVPLFKKFSRLSTQKFLFTFKKLTISEVSK